MGFRVNSARAIQFRQWATGVLRDYAIRGYVLDKERLKNGTFFSKEYFDNLLSEIREIRASGSSTRRSPIFMPRPHEEGVERWRSRRGSRGGGRRETKVGQNETNP